MTLYLAATSAAESDPMLGYLILSGAALVWIAGYFLACYIWPFGYCRRCKGTGKRPSPSGRKFRLCRRCDATGRRLRIGRRIWNHFHARKREAARSGR